MLILWLLLFAGLALEVRSTPRLDVGMVSRENIRAPERRTYESAIRTQRAQERAAADVADIYLPPNRSLAIQQSGNAEVIARFISTVRADTLATPAQKEHYLSEIQFVQFAPDQIKTLLTLPDVRWQVVTEETLRVVDRRMRGEIRETTLAAVLNNLSGEISLELMGEEADLVTAWAGALIIPNTFLDRERTDQARAAARAAVAPVEQTYETDQIIVREGEIVSAEQVEALQQFGLYQPQRTYTELFGIGSFMALLVIALGSYLAKFHIDYFRNPRVMSWFILMLFAMTIAIRLAMPESRTLAYLLPTSTVAMLLGVLLGVDVAVITTIVLAMVVGYVTNSLELIMYTLVGGIIAPLALRRIERLGVFVWTGLLVGLVNVVVMLTFILPGGVNNWWDLTVLAGIALVNGAASASLALGGFYVLSNALSITTFIQLMDLSRPNHPLFRELLTQAPGTYHHSIIVANLAEAAADKIGADPLLARVAAYYHDVGKIKNPHYFVENQSGQNPHDVLNDPYKSAEIIINHVKDGVALAKKHKVPSRIRDFIEQHHGTTQVAFFHAKALERDSSVLVDEARFRYPGPKPQRRESAILMLADSIEAYARVQKPATFEEINALVRRITEDKLRDGQLEECDLNLKDITTIQQAFIQVLQGVYHTRIAYPDTKPKVTISSTATVVSDGAARPAALPPVEKNHDVEPYRNPS